MRLLMLGGTVFLGRHLVEAALARGHELTLFTRGLHGAELFPEVERLTGDRDGNLDALRGREWDAVIDTSGYVPRLVRDSAALLAGSVAHYTFISTISVYAALNRPGLDERAPQARLADPRIEEVTGATYGALKALSERAAESAMPGRVLVVRPGLIVGPHDPSDRFTYWPARLAAGGEVLAPGRPERRVQFIDSRDLATWTLAMAERRAAGIYNANGPERSLAFASVLDCCNEAVGAGRLTWVPEAFLLDHGVTPWTGLPLWVPEREDNQGLMAVDCGRAITAGLRFRPLAETVRDTLAWDRTRDPSAERKAGISRAREREVLQAWSQRFA